MKLSEKLWCDLKSDSEKHSWLLMGMGASTGVVCHAIQTDLANSYHVKIQVEKERDAYRDLCVELVKQLKGVIAEAEFITQTDMAFGHGKLINKAEKLLGEKK